MKKLFSLLLVVAMIASMLIVSFAADTNVIGVVLNETAEGITVTYQITNPSDLSAVTAALQFPIALSCDTNAYTAGEKFSAGYTISTASKEYASDEFECVKFTGTFGSNTDKFVTETGTFDIVTFKLTRDAADTAVYTSADFAYSTKSAYVAKVVLGSGTNYTSKANADQFTAPVYTDNRGGNTPVVELGDAAEELASADYAAASAADKGTLTFVAKVSAEKLNEAYGVIVAGKKFFGAPATDSRIAADFVWDGSFEIVLTDITEKGTAGEKSFQYFVGDAVTNSATVNVVAE